MTTLQVKMNVPENRHLSIDLNLPHSVQPGEAEILLVIENIKNKNYKQISSKKQLIQKLANGPVWSDEDLTGFRKF